MKTYVDMLKTKNRVEYETERFFYISYSDYFMGEWFGNVNVFDKRFPDHFVLHATLTEPYTLGELKKFAKNYEKSLRRNKNA